jgi:hypothetical protein
VAQIIYNIQRLIFAMDFQEMAKIGIDEIQGSFSDYI